MVLSGVDLLIFLHFAVSMCRSMLSRRVMVLHSGHGLRLFLLLFLSFRLDIDFIIFYVSSFAFLSSCLYMEVQFVVL